MENKNKNNGHLSLDFAFSTNANTTTLTPKQTVKPEAKEIAHPEAKTVVKPTVEPTTKPEAKTVVKPQTKEKKEKKEIPPQIDDVEKELKERGGKGLYITQEKKTKKGKLVMTKTGKVANVLNPYRVGILRVKINVEGDYKLQWTKKDDTEPNKFIGIRISEKEYKAFLETASVNKRIDLLLKYKRELVKKDIKNDELLKVRCTIEEKSKALSDAKECGITVSELIRMRINNTQPHVPFTEKERKLQDVAMQRLIEMERFRNALSSYLKTTGSKGVQRLDAIFCSQPGTDYAREIWNVTQYLKKIFKIKEEVLW